MPFQFLEFSIHQGDFLNEESVHGSGTSVIDIHSVTYIKGMLHENEDDRCKKFLCRSGEQPRKCKYRT